MRSHSLWSLRTTSSVVFFAALASKAQAFEFSYSAPRSCDDLEVQWTGGKPPFQLLITPAFGTPRNVSIPTSNFDGNKGSFKTQLQMLPASDPQATEFLLTMSDAEGFGTGGTSGLLTAGDSATGAKCDLSDPGVAFNFQLPNNMQQCRDFSITQFVAAIQPVTIYGLIPSGDSFALRPPLGATDYDWQVNVAAGTSLILFMVDGQGRQGGASDLLRVGNSDERGCLNADSPHSTLRSTSSDSSTIPPTSASSPSNTPSETMVAPPPAPTDTGPNGAVIGGVIAGAIVAVVALATLGMFLYKRRRGDRDVGYYPSGKRGSRRIHSVDLTAAPPRDPDSPPVYPPPNDYDAVPFVFPPQPGRGPHQPERQYQYSITPYSPFSAGYPNTAPPSSYGGDDHASATTHNHQQNLSSHGHSSDPSQRSRTGSISSKAAMAGVSANGYGPAPRFILHTDAGSMNEVAEEVVELPPTYNDVNNGRSAPNTLPQDTQTPPPLLHSSSSGTSNNGASLVDSHSHPLASSPTPSRQRTSPTPPVLPPVGHQGEDAESFQFWSGSRQAAASVSPPQSPRGTRQSPPQQYEYPFASPTAQASGSNSSNLRGPLSPR